uniref:FANCI solenoid 2 domain-containing protein n=2 Tax=Spongospora subterranea TaxID=70186 RepID=A0A0H5QHJ1_9EUKA|eukprot:CRZ01448.1 hypothetical protein [Spongospora subterranea]
MSQIPDHDHIDFDEALTHLSSLLDSSSPLTPLSLHPVSVLLRASPLSASQFLLSPAIFSKIRSLPSSVYSHISLSLLQTLSTLDAPAPALLSLAELGISLPFIPSVIAILHRLPPLHRPALLTLISSSFTSSNCTSWLHAFSDMSQCLSPPVYSLIHTHIVQLLPHVKSEDYVPLSQNVLQLTGHSLKINDPDTTQSWAELIRKLYQFCPAVTIPDVMFVNEAAFTYNSTLLNIVLQSYESVQALTVSDMLLLICLCSAQPYIDCVMSPVFGILSSRRHTIDSWQQLICAPGISTYVPLITSWAESWFEKSDSMSSLAAGIIVAIFSHIESARSAIIALVLAGISEHDARPSLQERYLDLFARLPTGFLLSYISPLIEWMRYAGNISTIAAKRAFQAVLPLVMASNSFLDSCVVLFRKFLSSRISTERTLGVYGISNLLLVAGSSLPVSIQVDIATCIGSGLSASLAQRAIVYESISEILSGSDHRLDQQTYRAVFQMLDTRLEKYMVSKKVSLILSFADYFEDNSSDTDLITARDILPLLISCHISAATHIIPRPRLHVVEHLCLNPDSFLSALFIEGREWDMRRLHALLSSAGICDVVSERLSENPELISDLNLPDDLPPDKIASRLLQISAYIHTYLRSIESRYPQVKQIFSTSLDVYYMSQSQCQRLIVSSDLSASIMPRLVTSLNMAIEKSASRPHDHHIPSSSSSSIPLSNPQYLLRLLMPIITHSAPWSSTPITQYSPWISDRIAQHNLPLPTPSSFRHRLLNLFLSLIRQLKRLSPISQTCRFPYPDDDDLGDTAEHRFDNVDIMAISWCRSLQHEFSSGISVPIATSYLALLRHSIGIISSNAKDCFADILSTLLSTYYIRRATLVHSITLLLLSIQPELSLTLIQDKSRILTESDSCRFAAFDAVTISNIQCLNKALSALKPQLKSRQVQDDEFNAGQDTVIGSCSLISRVMTFFLNITEEVTSDSPRCLSRLLLLLTKLFDMSAKSSLLSSRLLVKIDHGSHDDDWERFAEIEKSIESIIGMIKAIPTVSSWINENRSTLSGRAVSGLVFKIATFEQIASEMVRRNRQGVAADLMRSVAKYLKRLKPCQANSNDLLERPRKRSRSHGKQLRSRIAYIDEALLEEGDGSDAYADLEDWIVD